MKINKIKNQIGATAIEYALLAGLIAIVAVTGVSATGSGVSKTLCDVAGKIGKTGCASALSPEDKMAQNSVVSNQSFADSFYANATRNYGEYDLSSLAFTGFKASDGSTISNMNDLSKALGITDVYNDYLSAFNNAKTAFGTSDYASSAGPALVNAYNDLGKSIASSSGKIETTGAKIGFNNIQSGKNTTYNFMNFGHSSSNITAGTSSVNNMYGPLSVSTPASNYQ